MGSHYTTQLTFKPDEVQHNQYSGYIIIDILLSYCQYVYYVVIHSMDSVIY